MRSLAAFAVLAGFGIGCGSSGSAHRLTTADTSVAVGEIVTVADDAGAFSATSYAGTLGGQAITLGRIDARTLAFVVPASVPAGAAELAVTVPGTSYDPLALTVEAAPMVADPAQTVGELVASYRTFIADARAATTDPVLLGWADAFEANVQFLEDSFAGLDAAGQLEIAQFVAANAAALSTQMMINWSNYATRVISTGAKMAFFGSATVLLAGSGGGVVPSLVTGAAFCKSAYEFGQAVFDQEAVTAITDYVGGITADAIEMKPTIRPRLLSITSDATMTIALTGDGRSIGEDDLTCERPDSQLEQAAHAIDEGGDDWAEVNPYLHEPLLPVPGFDEQATSGTVATDFFSIDPASISVPDVTLVSQGSSAGGLTVTFHSDACAANPDGVIPFTFDLVYDDGCRPVDKVTVDAELDCRCPLTETCDYPVPNECHCTYTCPAGTLYAESWCRWGGNICTCGVQGNVVWSSDSYVDCANSCDPYL